jgi:large subunit ribosomal protein L4
MKFTVFSPDGTTSREQEFDGVPTFDGDKGLQAVKEVIVAINANNRLGTHSTKTRAEVSGGGRKPWRQKGTGRARAGTIRAAQFTGGGVVFAPTMRSFDVKVNRKAKRSAFRGALSNHVANGTFGVLGADAFAEPSTKAAAALLASWGKESPAVIVATEGEQTLIKSFRNLEGVLVTVPEELGVAAVVWARTLLVTEAALPLVQGRAA